jgi:hypothetical protein
MDSQIPVIRSRSLPVIFAATRGSVLIVAMIISAVISVSLVSYLQMSRTSLEISNGAFYRNAAMNLAENGLEEAMYAINKTVADSSYSWSEHGWDTAYPVPVGDARRRLPSESTTYNFDQNVTGIVRVYVFGYNSSAPRAVARSIITLSTGQTIQKWVEIRLRKSSRFANGLVAKDSIRFSGSNASVDSWHSKKNDDGTPRTTPVSYSSAVDHDKGSIGSISIGVDAVLVQNADIWGYAATGGALPNVGANGLIGPFGTPANTMDMSRVSTNFTTSFDPVGPPANGGDIIGDISTNLNLPRAADTLTDGKYYYTVGQIAYNNKTLAIKKKTPTSPAVHVVITLTNPTTSINIGGGSGALNIESGSQLELYAPGDIRIAGQGIMNGGTTAGTANLPESLLIWGTKTSGVQDIQIAGNGALSAVVYAPQGSVKINGNGDVCGSVVANDITLVGNAAFHYDESLGDFGGNNPFRVALWHEISSAAERSAITVLDW